MSSVLTPSNPSEHDYRDRTGGLVAGPVSNTVSQYVLFWRGNSSKQDKYVCSDILIENRNVINNLETKKNSFDNITKISCLKRVNFS